MPSIPIKLVPAPFMLSPSMPKDPTLRAIAEDVLAKLKYSFAAAAAEDQSPAPGDLDHVARLYLDTRSAPLRNHLRGQSQALLASPMPRRTLHFRRYAEIDAKEFRVLSPDNLAMRVGMLPVQKQAVEPALKAYTRTIIKLPPGFSPKPPTDPDWQAGMAFKKLRLIISRVHCMEETSGPGSDEINMGGIITDPFGNTTKVSEFEVSDDFDQYEQEVLNRVFGTWDLQTDKANFPYVYSAVIALAEKDDGGFWKFLQELWAKVENQVKGAISALTGAAIGAAIGATFAGIGAIVGAVFGSFVGWLLSVFGDNADDPIGALPAVMTLGWASKSYYDWAKLTSPAGWTDTLTFKGDGGKYKVGIRWRVSTQ